MSQSIDERVVSLKFDNKQFESAAASSMSTLDKLKAKLNFKGAAKGLEEITKTADSVSLSSLTKSADAVEVKFSAMSVAAITAIQRIVDKAITAGEQIVKSLTLDPISTGFSEYELKMNSVQTIMASTGEDLNTVMGYLNELNEYADKTIYSFADMTTNIGKFTNAGVKLEDAVKAIQGISNEAAVSGANANEASRAMYNFAQALSAGYVKLIDWKSIELANMATVEFKDQLLETAAALGTVTKAADGTYRTLNGEVLSATYNFNESLQQQWLTTDVLIKTLGDYADATTDIGKKAFAAAQDVKTFSQLLDTLREAAGSGWAETWEIVVGNFEEAKELWTTASNVIGGILGDIANERNEMLSDWRDLGGRTALLNIFGNAWKALLSVIKPVRDAIRDIFPPTTGQQLLALTQSVEKFTQSLILSEEAAYTLKVALKVFLVPLVAIVQVIRVGISAISFLVLALWNFVDSLLAIPSTVGGVSKALRNVFGDELYERAATALIKITEKVINTFESVINSAKNMFSYLKGNKLAPVSNAFKSLLNILTPVADILLEGIVRTLEFIADFDGSALLNFGKNVLQFIIDKFNEFINLSNPVSEAIRTFIGNFNQGINTGGLSMIQQIFQAIAKTLSSFSFSKVIGDIFDTLKGGIETVITGIKNFVLTIIDMVAQISPARIALLLFAVAIIGLSLSITRAISSLAGAMDAVAGTLNGFAGILSTIKNKIAPSQFAQNAAAVALLAGALYLLAQNDPARIIAAAAAITIFATAIGVLSAGFAVLEKFIGSTSNFGRMFAYISVGVVAMSGALWIFSTTLEKMADISWSGILKSIAMIVGVLGTMTAMLLALNRFAPTIFTGTMSIKSIALAMIAMAAALRLIEGIQINNVTNIIQSLIAIVGSMAVISIAAGKVSFSTGAGLVLMAGGLILFAKVLEQLSKFDTAKLYASIVNFMPIFTALVALSIVSRTVSKRAAAASISILGMIASLVAITGALHLLNTLDVGSLQKSIIAMTAIFGIFAILSKSMQVISKDQKVANMAPSILAITGAVMLLSLAIDYLGDMDAKAIARSTIAIVSMLGMFVLLAKVGDSAKGMSANLIIASISVTLIAGIFAILASIETKDLEKKIAALISIIGSMSLMFYATSKIKTGAKVTDIIYIVSYIGALTAAFKMLEGIKPANILSSAAGLSIAVATMSSIPNITARIDWKKALTSAASMALMLGMVTSSIVILNNLGVENAAINAISLAGVIAALSTAVFLISQVNAAGVLPGLASLGVVLALVAGTLYIISSIIGTSEYQNFVTYGDSFISAMERLAPLMIVLSAVALGLSLLGPLSAGVVAGGVAVGAITAVIGGVIFALGALIQDENTVAVIERGSAIFSAIGTAIGSFIGNVVGAIIGSAISTTATTAAEGLSDFGDKLQPFLNFVAGITDEQVSGVGKVAAIVAAITAASVIDGIANILGIKGSLTDVGEELKEFATPFSEFVTTVSKVGLNKITVVTNAVNSIATLLSNMPVEGGLLGAIFGGKDLSSFGSGLTSLGTGIIDYWNSIKDANIVKEKVETSVEAAKNINTLVNELQNTGGHLQTLFGSKDASYFGNSLNALATGIVDYNKAIVDGKINVTAIENSAEAAGYINDLVNEMQSTGGTLQTFTGTKDISYFATALSGLALGIATYNKEIIDAEIDKEAIKESAEAAGYIVSMAANLQATGGELQRFLGEKDLSVFATDLSSLATGVSDFTKVLNDAKFDPAYMKESTTAIGDLIETISGVPSKNGLASGILYLADMSFEKVIFQIHSLGTTLAAFQNNINGLESTKLDGIVGFVDDIGTSLSDNSEGIENAADDLKTIFEVTFSKDTETFKRIGENVVEGVSNGIDSNEKTATDTIRRMAKSVINAANDVFEINSPSKVFYAIGQYVIQGLINGMNDEYGNNDTGIKKIGLGIIDKFKMVLGIHSPSTVARDEVGRYIVSGIAEGITTDMSAEDAAEKKASNIVSAFRDKLDEISSDVELIDLQDTLQTNLLEEPLSAEQELDKNLDITQKKLELQAERVAYANAEYQATLQEFGETSTYTKEAYNKFLQEQVNLSELAGTFYELQNTMVVDEKEAMKSYADILSEYSEAFKLLGWTQEQIHEYARQESGYADVLAQKDADKEFNSVKDVFDKYMTDVEVIIDRTVSSSSESGATSATNFVNGFNSQISSEVLSMTSTVEEVANAVTDVFTPDKFIGTATNVVDGLIDGLTGGIKSLGDKGVELFNSLKSRFDNTAEIKSPSRKMMESGEYLVEGLAEGINNKAYLARDAIANLFVLTDNNLTDNEIPSFINKVVYGISENEASIISGVGGSLDAIINGATSGREETYYQNGFDLSYSLASGILDGFKTTYQMVFTEISGLLDNLETEIIRRANEFQNKVGSMTMVMSERVGGNYNINYTPIPVNGPNGFTPVTSSNIAARISSGGSPGVTNVGGNTTVTNNYSMVQNNTSPKALSRAEIYRDTKNQFAAFREAVSNQ